MKHRMYYNILRLSAVF